MEVQLGLELPDRDQLPLPFQWLPDRPRHWGAARHFRSRGRRYTIRFAAPSPDFHLLF